MTENSTLISAENVSKKFCADMRSSLWYGVRDIAGEALFGIGRSAATRLRKGEFWALQDVSFELKRGEALAVVGNNGSGKSTLLKLLYGLIRPDAGEITIRGKLGAIIELHAGLDPMLTGRENIYIKAALYGIGRQNVRRIIDDIIDFAELGEFIDSPTQFYSSGMRSRLGFAIAAHLEPDILLLDEVLAVGDFIFQRKCLTHLQKFIARGGSLILVSHNPYQIQSTCGRGILLNAGQIVYSGDAIETLDHYFQQARSPQLEHHPQQSAALCESKPLAIDSVTVKPGKGSTIKTGGDMELIVEYRSFSRISETNWHFSLWTAENSVCVAGSALIPAAIEQGAGRLRCRVPNVHLTAGTYLTKVAVGIDEDSLFPLAISGWQDNAASFTVHSETSRLTNAQSAQRQLTVLEVEW